MKFLRHRLLWASVALVALAAAGIAAWIEWRDPLDPADTHAIAAFTIPPREPGVAYERFFAFGDSGTGGFGQRRVARAMREASENGLDFILMLGDNFYPDGVATPDDERWQKLIVDPYESFRVPIFPTLGNHDHHVPGRAQIERTKIDPLWRMPSEYYTFTRTLGDGTRVQFWALDTTPLAEGDDDPREQLAWFTSSLAAADGNAEWRVVFGHHPVISHGKHGDSDDLVDRVETMLAQHHVDLYLAGHDHSLELMTPMDGVRYVTAGGGSGTDNADEMEWNHPSTEYAATRGGFVAVRVSRHEMLVEFVRPDGETQYATSWRK